MKIKQFTFNPYMENTYVVWCEESMEGTIIDCGASTDNETEELEFFVEGKGIKIMHLLNTHMHPDHCVGNPWASEKYGIRPEKSEGTIQIGKIKFNTIPTPGHTEDGVCFYNESEKILFAGDTLFNGSIGRTDLPGGSYSTLIASIRERLLVLPDETTVYCGHGPTTTIGDEKKYNPFL